MFGSVGEEHTFWGEVLILVVFPRKRSILLCFRSLYLHSYMGQRGCKVQYPTCECLCYIRRRRFREECLLNQPDICGGVGGPVAVFLEALSVTRSDVWCGWQPCSVPHPCARESGGNTCPVSAGKREKAKTSRWGHWGWTSSCSTSKGHLCFQLWSIEILLPDMTIIWHPDGFSGKKSGTFPSIVGDRLVNWKTGRIEIHQ